MLSKNTSIGHGDPFINKRKREEQKRRQRGSRAGSTRKTTLTDPRPCATATR